jgi:hypothetical protein
MTSTLQPPPGTSIGDAFGSALDVVRRELAHLVDVQTWTLDKARLGQRIADALAARASVDEVLSRLVAEADDRNLAKTLGASSTKAHLVHRYRLSGREAAKVVRTARALNGPSALTEPTREALANGVVSAEQAVVVAEAIGKVSPTISSEHVERAQVDLIRLTEQLTFEQLRHAANHLVEVLDPEHADEILGAQLEAAEQRHRKQTRLSLRVHDDGSCDGRFHLGPVPTATLQKALEAFGAPRRSEHADNPLTDPDTGQPLPYGNRLGLAFAEMVEHLPLDELPQHGVSNASIVVTLDAAALTQRLGEAMLDTGAAISLAETRRLACNAGLLPIVLGSPSQILDLGLSQRLFTRHQRIALAQRDGGCIWPGCWRPAAWTEAHHVDPWSNGGPTDLANGCLLCPFHHHLVHEGEWQVQIAADGIPDVIPPTRIDPARQPIRHQRFRPRPG